MTRILLDCDPGHDDAVAIIVAARHAHLLGITTVAGNVPLKLTQRNARMMCDIAGQFQLQIFAGCEQPMVREAITAEYIHGATGIDGVDVFEPKTPLQDQHAVDFIIESLSNAEENSVTLVPTGPLTNIGTALQREPAILDRGEEIVLMGGAMRESGNRSPSAECNIMADPHAANIVFDCGRPVTALGLDVTHQVLSTPDRVRRVAALANPVADATVGMLSFFHRYDTKKYGSEGTPLHDPCTVAYLLRPELFESKMCNISVETESPLTVGHTAVDFWHVTDRPVNANWVFGVEADGFYDLLNEHLARFGDLK